MWNRRRTDLGGTGEYRSWPVEPEVRRPELIRDHQSRVGTKMAAANRVSAGAEMAAGRHNRERDVGIPTKYRMPIRGCTEFRYGRTGQIN